MKTTVSISIINGSLIKIDRKIFKEITPLISATMQTFRKNRYGKKVRQTYQKPIIYLKDKQFVFLYRGHLLKIYQYLRKHDYEVKITGSTPPLNLGTPKLKGITLRKDQMFLIEQIQKYNRGVIKSPTGTGKTIMQLALIDAIQKISSRKSRPENINLENFVQKISSRKFHLENIDLENSVQKILFMAHSTDILMQTKEKLEKLLGLRIGRDFQYVQGQAAHQEFTCPLVLASIQTMSRITPEKYRNYFQCIIVDEAHHISTPEGMYAEVMGNCVSANIRIGFTATMPYKEIAKQTLEGVIGPLIGEVHINDSIKEGILAKPTIRLVRSALSTKIYDIKNYAKAYEKGITTNVTRNTQIIDIVYEYIQQKKTVLIMVTKVAHGEQLQRLFHKKYNLQVPFVYGKMENTQREIVKNNLINKRELAAIATVVWKEGVDIPNLDVVINACGGKSEIAILQTIGRGLRTTENKSTVTIVDFFDPSNLYFIAHFGERLAIYFDNGWM